MAGCCFDQTKKTGTLGATRKGGLGIGKRVKADKFRLRLILNLKLRTNFNQSS